MFEICRTKFESDQNTDFVAIGNLVDDNGKKSSHAAFIIQFEDELFEFHYTGRNVEYSPIKRDYYHKITYTILPEEVPSFIALCKHLVKTSKPIYGFFYSGEFYNDEGHQHHTELGERMTCVGFCLNVFKTFLEEDYIQFQDWNGDTEDWKEYLEDYCIKNNLDPSRIKESVRRITPRECLTSCFFNILPIRKADIDNKIKDVNNHFVLRFAEMKN